MKSKSPSPPTPEPAQDEAKPQGNYIGIAHPHDHIARRFLIDAELMADLLTYYPLRSLNRSPDFLLAEE